MAQCLSRRGEQLGSRLLSAVAAHVSDNPFGKLKKTIKDLIVRLSEEANEETEYKG